MRFYWCRAGVWPELGMPYTPTIALSAGKMMTAHWIWGTLPTLDWSKSIWLSRVCRACTFCHQPGGSTTCFRTIDIYWLLSDSTSHCRLELGCDYVDISDVVFCWAFGDWFCTLSAQDLNSLQPTAPPSSTCLAAFQRQALGSALSSFVGVLHRSRGESLGVGGGYPVYQVSV